MTTFKAGLGFMCTPETVLAGCLAGCPFRAVFIDLFGGDLQVGERRAFTNVARLPGPAFLERCYEEFRFEGSTFSEV
ncbi:MAG: hypothetical protein Aurels2KO_00700 [Aureliella sp.]